jgi:hypothetical protein
MRSGEVSEGTPPVATKLEPGREQLVTKDGKVVVVER